MSFLARLIERHRTDGVTGIPRVEPRIPSRYEPVACAGEREGLEHDIAIETFRETEPVPPPVRRVARPPRAAHEAAENLDPPLAALTAALSAARSTIEAPEPAAAPIAPLTAPARDIAPAPAPRSSSSPDEDPVAGAPPSRERAVRPSLEPVPARRPAPLASPSIRVERAEAAPSAPSTIHVSIGRVDVRAIVAPAPTAPSRPAPAASRLALEDYLRGTPRGSR